MSSTACWQVSEALRNIGSLWVWVAPSGLPVSMGIRLAVLAPAVGLLAVHAAYMASIWVRGLCGATGGMARVHLTTLEKRRSCRRPADMSDTAWCIWQISSWMCALASSAVFFVRAIIACQLFSLQASA